MKRKSFLIIGTFVVSLLASCSNEETFSSIYVSSFEQESSSLDQGCGGFSAPLVNGFDFVVGRKGRFLGERSINKDENNFPLEIWINKRKEAKIQTFTLSSTTPLTVWYDENDNDNIETSENVYHLTSEPTVIDWIWNEDDETDNSAAALAGYCTDPHAAKRRVYKVKHEGLFEEDFDMTMNDIIYSGEENNIYVESGLYPGEIHKPRSYIIHIDDI